MTNQQSKSDATAGREGYLERNARQLAQSLAIHDEGRGLTWEEWNQSANRCADALARRGVGPGVRVALRMMNRSEWFIIDAALAKLGAERVSIAWRLVPSEVRHILENSRASTLFFDDEDPLALALALSPAFVGGPANRLPDLRLLVSLRPTNAAGVVSFEKLLRSGEQRPRESGGPPASVIYTSGTTGRPKGVQRSAPADTTRREGLERLNADLKRSIPYRQGDRNLLCAPLNHAAAPSSALATHARGGTVYVMRRFDAEDALRVIDRERITVSFMVPTMLNRIVNLPTDVRARYDVSCLRIVTTGAAPCSKELKQRVREAIGPCLYESYGCTETGIVTISTPADAETHPDSCGRLLDGTDVRVLDDAGQELPRGEIGQIFIKSPLTIAAYLAEPSLPPELMSNGYFTAGDVGRLCEDGFLYVLDRKKDMIIAGGVNVYPAEVEAALREHPAVLDAAVFGVPSADLGEEIRAVCERVPGAQVEAPELAAFVSLRIATYKRPRQISFVSELPRNAAGKVLKRELRAPYWASSGRVI